MKPFITREKMANVLAANMSTKTIRSPWLARTAYQNEEVNEGWYVTRMYIDTQSVLVLECCPKEYLKGRV